MLSKALLAAFSLLAASGSSSAQAVELRLSTVAPSGHVWVKVAERLKQELEAKPELDLQLSIFANSQLGQEPELMQQLETGLLDLGALTLASLVTREEGFNGWFTPYLISDVEAAGRARDLPASQAMLDNLADVQMVGLGYVFGGMRQILSKGAPIDAAEDLGGLKVRITPFPAAQTWWNAMNATPTPIPLSNVYQALQTGVVDAIDIDLDATVSLSLQEVAESLTLTRHMPWPGAIVASSATWARLTEQQQQGLRDAIKLVTDFGVEAQAAAEATNLEKIRGALTVAEVTNGEEALAIANDAFQAEFGDIQLVKKFQGQVRAQK